MTRTPDPTLYFTGARCAPIPGSGHVEEGPEPPIYVEPETGQFFFKDANGCLHGHWPSVEEAKAAHQDFRNLVSSILREGEE